MSLVDDEFTRSVNRQMQERIHATSMNPISVATRALEAVNDARGRRSVGSGTSTRSTARTRRPIGVDRLLRGRR